MKRTIVPLVRETEYLERGKKYLDFVYGAHPDSLEDMLLCLTTLSLTTTAAYSEPGNYYGMPNELWAFSSPVSWDGSRKE
jgi:hypothetical protein